jgi:hypothetical protein
MNGIATSFLMLTAAALLMLPRRWALLPLLLGACYMTNAQQFVVGPFHWTVLRVLILIGFVRAMAHGERLVGGFSKLDCVVLCWGLWLSISSVFHKPFGEALIFRLGMAYNTLGLYFLTRLFCQNMAEMAQLVKITCYLLVPVAFEMVNEKFTGHNLFSLFGGVPVMPEVRDGHFRSQGPFAHSILAGTVGAVCVPLMIGIWREHGLSARVGIAACLAMVITSKSSGPLMTVFCGLFALTIWRWRHLTRWLVMAGVACYVGLDLVMKVPAYYILSRIDLTGSSGGWHRARLIESSIEHISEWYFAGTDHTRHWMPTGVSWSLEHTDITNHYLLYGVWGGLPLVALFVYALWVGFSYVGRTLEWRQSAPVGELFLVWALGADLFAHAATCVSVAYFDQSVMFLFLNLAALGSLQAFATSEPIEEEIWLEDDVEEPVGAPGLSVEMQSVRA